MLCTAIAALQMWPEACWSRASSAHASTSCHSCPCVGLFVLSAIVSWYVLCLLHPRPGAHFIVRECAGQINMLLSSLVLGPMHIHGVANSHYLDPSPAIQQAWSEAPRKHSAIVEASSSSRGRTVVYATINSSVEFDLGKLK